MNTLTPPSAAVTPLTVDEFLDLVLADDELLRAEFDDIIDAAWHLGPPPAPQLRRPSGQRPVGRGRTILTGSSCEPDDTSEGAPSGRGSQRGPPHARARDATNALTSRR